MTDKIVPNFYQIENEMTDIDLKLHPSEVHGLMTGAICAKVNMPKELSDQMTDLMTTLYDTTAQQLRDFLFDFDLLLPDDQSILPVRAEAFTLWCQGFITGLHDVYDELKMAEPSDVTEALLDLVEVAKMKFQDVIPSEEDESAYIDLVEYIRMAVILIYHATHETNEQSNHSNDTAHLH
jgi:hypothetical protein